MRYRLVLPLLVFACAIVARAENPGDLGFLKALVDKYPNDIKLWTNHSLEPRLKNLLGNEYSVFVENMKVNSPLNEYSDVIWTSGNKPHDGGINAALFLADIKNNLIEVYLLTNGKLLHFGEANSEMILNGDAQVVLDNFQAAAAEQAPGE